jgi:hypothetical protein
LKENFLFKIFVIISLPPVVVIVCISSSEFATTDCISTEKFDKLIILNVHLPIEVFVRVVGGSKSPFQSKKDFLFSFLMLYTSKIGGVFNGRSSSKNVLYIVK